MKIEIVANSDENFKVFLTPTVESSTPATEEVPSVDVLPIPPMPVPQEPSKPAPLENPKSRRFGWFDNTSWDDGKRGHQF